MIIEARHYQTGKPIRVTIERGKYKKIQSTRSTKKNLPFIAPGLVDVQINGFGGIDFNRPTFSESDWEHACKTLYENGCTHFLLTWLTNTREGYQKLFAHTEPLRRKRSFNWIGYHIEGPFLNPDPRYHGCHKPAWMLKPDFEWVKEWQQLSNNNIRNITIAPEVDLDGSEKFIKQVVREKIRISIGHSGLMGGDLKKMVDAGASCWTHLGNALQTPLDKYENVILHTLAFDGIRATLIPDTHHVPPHAFKVMARLLRDRMMLTSDTISAAAAPPGRYTIAHLEIEVGPDKIARMPGEDRFAGATAGPFSGVFHATDMSGLPWSCLWDAFSTKPADWLGIKHGLSVGNEASFCLVDVAKKPKLLATYAKGEVAFQL